MSFCIQNKDCRGDEFCKAGRCREPLVRGDPCKEKCGKTKLKCAKEIGRCVESGTGLKPPACKDDLECSTSQYCAGGTCKDRADPFAKCSEDVPCKDGYSCYEGICAARCLRDGDCWDHNCDKVPGVEGFKVCMKKVDWPKKGGDGVQPQPDPKPGPGAADVGGGMSKGMIVMASGGAVIIIAVLVLVLMKLRRNND